MNLQADQLVFISFPRLDIDSISPRFTSDSTVGMRCRAVGQRSSADTLCIETSQIDHIDGGNSAYVINKGAIREPLRRGGKDPGQIYMASAFSLLVQTLISYYIDRATVGRRRNQARLLRSYAKSLRKASRYVR